MERRLAAVLAADVVGYSRLMGVNEAGTLAALNSHRAELFEPKTAQYNGRTIKLMGDGALMEFPSVVDAVTFAVEVQSAMQVRNTGIPEDQQILYRIGINIGDIIVEGNDIHGDGVNVAARIEGVCEPGGVSMARNVFNQVKDKLDITFDNMGEKEMKNIVEPVTIYTVVFDAKAAALVTPVVQEAAKRRSRRWLAGSAAVVLVLAIGGIFYWHATAPEFPPANPEKMAFPLPKKPSLAVLPFSNIGGDPEQEFLADGITNDLITDLSKFNHLFVIAANSTFTYKGKAVKVQQVAEDLGVRYVLEGSVQRAGDTLRINAQLIDALTGHHLWAERYDRKAENFFEIQNEIIKTIVGSMQVKMTGEEIERASSQPTESLSAYDYYLKGFAKLREWTKESHQDARALVEKSIALDPNYARAYTILALTYINEWRNGWVEDTSQSKTRAVESARQSVELGPEDYWTHWGLARIYNWIGETDRSLASYELALKLNPHDPTMLMTIVELLVSLGKADEAVVQAKNAIRHNPLHPNWYLWSLGWAEYFAGQHEEAVATLKRMPEPPNNLRRDLAAALVQAERLDEAREVADAFLREAPNFTVTSFKDKSYFKHRPYVEKQANDLLRAGLPE